MKAIIVEKRQVAQKSLMVKFSVKEPFIFKPGQYLILVLAKLHYPDDRGNSRFFSIINSPSEKGVLTITTRLRDSGFKKTIAELPVGSEVEIVSIRGDFVLPQDSSRPLVFIAGGIGITPFVSMLRFVDELSLSYTITLIYSNRDRSSTAYFDEIEKLAKKSSNIKFIPIMTQDSTWKGEKRHIDENFIREYFPDVNKSLYFVVGPPQMVESIVEALEKAGVANENIKAERFTGY